MPTTAIASVTPAGTISYNGITFDTLTNCRLIATPQFDRADRTVTHIQYRLIVHGFIWGATVSNCETGMDAMQDALTQPGRTLTITDMGFDVGSITTNKTGTRPDVLWGVKPRLLDMQPMGLIAWEFTWECEFNISRCAAGDNIRAMPLLALNYEWSQSVDEQGLSTRTIAGYLQVPALRGDDASRVILFNVDSKWDSFTVNIPPGFRRINNTRRINDARNQIDFVLIDRQLTGTAFPPGIVDGQMKYSFENHVESGFVQWIANLSGHLTTAPGVAPDLAAEKFLLLLADKVQKLRQSAGQTGNKALVLPMKLRFTTTPIGDVRTSEFGCTMLVTAKFTELLKAAGLWQPAPGIDWQQWATSMQAVGVFNNRGVAALRFNTNDDRIIDPCDGTQTASIGNDAGFLSTPTGGYQQIFGPENVTKENSYLSYHNSIRSIGQNNLSFHHLAQPSTPPSPGTATTPPDNGIATLPTPTGLTDHVTESNGAPSTYVIMEGRAVRIKFAPEPPTLVNIDGTPVEELSRDVQVLQKGNHFGVPIFLATWSIMYRVKGPITSVKATPNPALLTD